MKDRNHLRVPGKDSPESTILGGEEMGQLVQAPPPFQLKAEPADPPNDAGTKPSGGNGNLPDDLRAGMENLSGMDLGNVKVHYNSEKPAQVQAYAYAQGEDIHLGPGQEQHLGHEAWHVVQQKQGRVQANTEVNGAPVNDHAGLETEADQMGAKALQLGPVQRKENLGQASVSNPVLQGKWMVGRPGEAVILGAEDLSENPIVDLVNFLYQMGFPFHAEEIVSYIKIWREEWEGSTLFSEITKLLVSKALSEEVNTLDNLAGAVLTRLASEADNTDEESETAEGELEGDAPGEEFHHGGGAEEEEVFPQDLQPGEFELNDEGLLNAFALAAGKYNIPISLENFAIWIQAPIGSEKDYFKFMKEEDSEFMDDDSILQLARKPGSRSGPKTYQTSKHGKFKGVQYKLDSKGNIDFGSPRRSTVWTNPVKTNSWVQLNRGSKNKKYGIMKSGKKVNIAGASRPQHFSIANRIKKIRGSGSPDGWTWHHLSPRYEMELVDREVHAKHGHNGGVYIW